MYNKKPEMIIFDVGGTLFDDGKCVPEKGFSALLSIAENPEITTERELAGYWNEFFNEVSDGFKTKDGKKLETPLSAVIKYATMNAGLHIALPISEQEELFDRFNSSRCVIDGVPELFKTLENLDIRYGIISNNAMSGESLALSIKHWLPSINPEFTLTSADILFAKPYEKIFYTALKYAHLTPEDCWYCGDGRIPDVEGAKNAGITPVFLDVNSKIPLEFRTDGGRGAYLTINSWKVLKEFLEKDNH